MIKVNLDQVRQRIDGFGASSAWMNSISPIQAELFFSSARGIVYTDKLHNTTTCNGIGLSLLRNRIVPATTTAATDTPKTDEASIMQAAQSYGARVWSTPWTPASGFKDSNTANGGNYLGSGNNATNLAYASQLANYVASMKKNYSVNLHAISVQNEPDGNHPYVSPTQKGYESCVWTPQQIHDFVPHLYAALANAGVGSTQIMLPESQGWTDTKGLAALAMTDPAVAANVGIIANHDYGDDTVPAVINAYGKTLWQTEVSLLSGSDSSMTNALFWAVRINLLLTVAQVNAYHYWWLISLSTTGVGNEGLLDTNASITKRLFVFGQFSRFIRPGYMRVDVGYPGGWTDTHVSAYTSPRIVSMPGNFVIVFINNTASEIPNLLFEVPEIVLKPENPGYQGPQLKQVPIEVTPWVTSSTLSLAPQPAIPIKNSIFTYNVPANSVVTFEGKSKIVEG